MNNHDHHIQRFVYKNDSFMEKNIAYKENI